MGVGTWPNPWRSDVAANRGLATAYGDGSYFFATDTFVLSQSDGSSWTDIATLQPYDADTPTVAASQAEMEAGTETALRSMSPLRVAQAIAALETGTGGGAVTVVAHGNTGSTETFDFGAGSAHSATVNAGLTVTLTGATNGEEAELHLYLITDGTGGYTITWPGSVVWASGSAPDPLAVGETMTVVLTSIDGGTIWRGFRSQPVEAVDVAFDATGLTQTSATDVQVAIEDLDAAIDALTGGGGTTELLASIGYAAGADAALSTISTTTMTDVDSTNASVTFTAPASGTVLVKVEALYSNTADVAYWGLRESSTTLATFYIANGQSGAYRYAATFRLTGISAGSHTYKFAHKLGSTTSNGNLYSGPTFGQVIMEVWAA